LGLTYLNVINTATYTENRLLPGADGDWVAAPLRSATANTQFTCGILNENQKSSQHWPCTCNMSNYIVFLSM